MPKKRARSSKSEKPIKRATQRASKRSTKRATSARTEKRATKPKAQRKTERRAAKKTARQDARNEKLSTKRVTASAPAATRAASGSGSGTGLAFRLPSSVRPDLYRIHIEVDPSRGKEYRGEVSIELSLAKGTGVIELHAADLDVHAASFETTHGQWDATVEAHSERETISVALVTRTPKGRVVAARAPAGRGTLKLRFTGKLRSDLHGLYGASSGGRQYAFTQLEAADARRFFPCFDEPSFKARFALAVTTSEHNNVVSNNPVLRVQMFNDGRKTVYFSETPLLSTYLVALAVGELEASEPVYAGDVAIRLLHVPGNGHLTAFALDAARECLTRLVDYFGIPYPYAKLDLLAVPDFEIGAMENAGAVFFRETLLLIDEQTVSLAEKKRAAEVICHELAHMWYGNLVTMQWWDDLWLNEAFATWMAFDIVAKWHPEWKMWNDFGHSRNSALHLDALHNTHAIYTKVGTPADATENFDLITYEKGAAVVRMIERYLGPAVFQRGVRKYLARHREGNAVAADLWRALEEAGGDNVAQVVRAWISTPGFPLLRLTQKAAARGGKTELVIEQEQFHASGPVRGKHEAATRWLVPFVARVGQAGKTPNSRLERKLLGKARETLTLRGPVDYIYGNADEGGFFRPLHDGQLQASVLAALPSLSSAERLGLLHHAWALVRAGYAPLASFLPLFSALANEPDADVLRAITGPAALLVDDIAQGTLLRKATQRLVADSFGPAFSALGWSTAASEPNDTRLLRAELASLVALVAEEPSASAAGEQCCQEYLRARSSIDPNLAGVVLSLGARHADEARFEAYVAASISDPTPQERRRFRMALGDMRDPALVQRALELCLGEQIPTQDVALLLARLLVNRAAQIATWTFIKERWPALRERMPAMLASRLIDATPALREERYRKEVAEFFKANPLPTAARALRQTQERFKLDAAFRLRATPALAAFLRVEA